MFATYTRSISKFDNTLQLALILLTIGLIYLAMLKIYPGLACSNNRAKLDRQVLVHLGLTQVGVI
jgi:hypothetical protein